MFYALIAFMSQKFLLIGAALGSVYVLWLGRSKEKVKEELKDVRVAYSQEKACRDQVEEMVAKAHEVLEEQHTIEREPVDVESIHDWLLDKSHDRDMPAVSKAIPSASVLYDAATVSKTSSKDR